MDIIITTISTSALLSILIFLFRNLLLTRLTNAIKHEYNEKLETLKAELKAENDILTSELKHLSDSKLQRNAEDRKIKQEYYHTFLEVLSTKFSHLKNLNTEDAILANKKFCIEVNRLPLYASQEIVEIINNFTNSGKAPKFTELYILIRKDLCSNSYDNFNKILPINFQIPNQV